jgi:peptide/nickel transport system permease protein
VAAYVLKRIAAAVPLLFGLLTITFFIIRLAPGEPDVLYIEADSDPEYAGNLRRTLGLDQPIHVQYLRWLASVAEGEFGTSFSKHAPVDRIIGEALPNTLLLTGSALAVSYLLGILLGVFGALRRGTASDYGATISALVIYSMPEFWMGLMLILLLSEAIPLFPASGMHSPMAEYLPAGERVLDTLHHLVLPVLVLGVASAAATGRYMRGSLLDVMSQEYILTARAKGLSELQVVGKHAMRNAMIPIITLFGLSLPFLLGGAVIVETVFSWPGMGMITVDAIFTRDYPLIIGCTVVSGCMVITGNLIADVLCALVDPRIRLTG